ncbi:MAG: phospho-N-acetylmuramoyl-pentapeptide-transferase [Campylobacterota bacterium]|nr:phospho-N-acetylmuramoyl-pentapeptide-transferase [Campylobacterota bacterium]
MLYYLYSYFDINLLQYITVRAGIAFFIALLITLFVMPLFIRWAIRSSSHQPINEYVPAHKEKAKTPTMGGIVFIGATVIASLLTIKFDNLFAVGGVLTLLLFALIGFFDDWGKIKNQANLAGLSARGKLAMQIGASLLVTFFLYYIASFNSELYLPFMKNPLFDMHIGAIFFWALVIIATSNAVNLTDGLDGLATVPSIAALISLSAIIYIIGHAGFSKYLLMPNFPVGEAVIVGAALVGALVGFLWFNSHPAEVFMGDSGSLTIGAFIAYMAIVGKSEVLLLLIGSIFVIETVSVILQIGSYKIRKKRIFLMAPIHHHFEMKNWAENKIIVRFWIIAMLSNLLALISLKIR